MSEYQYYEFQAVDRPLTKEEMGALRKITTRATITTTRLQNEYHWGNFKGDPLELMERYFDAFVYVANWGTNQLMLRLPQGVIDQQTASRYTATPYLEIHQRGDHIVIDFMSQDEEGEWWITDEGPESWMPSFLPLRDELAHGDPRCLYLGWLAAAEVGEVEDDTPEPPVPPGLGSPSAALKALADFLRLSPDLLAVAAERSGAEPNHGPSSDEISSWLREVPEPDKDSWLLAAASGNGLQLQAAILRRYRNEHPTPAIRPEGEAGRRTVGELIAAAQQRARQRHDREAEQQAREKAALLEEISGRQETIWHEAENLISQKKSASYDEAVKLLIDLRELAQRDRTAGAFDERIRQIRRQNRRRPGIKERLNRAGFVNE